MEGEKSAREEKAKFSFLNFYEKQYKKLLIIPVVLLLLSFAVIGMTYVKTGDFIHKGVTLKGGVTITIPTEEKIDIESVEKELMEKFPAADISVRTLASAGKQNAIAVSATDAEEKELVAALEARLGNLGDYAVETTGPSLGQSFFKEAFRAIIVAFLFMGVVVFLYFSQNTLSKVIALLLTIIAGILMIYSKSAVSDSIVMAIGIVLVVLYFKYSIPSVAVIISAFADMVVTVAIANLIGLKFSTAGIASVLMLIGYSVDTDMLLSIRVLKSKEGTIFSRNMGAMKTGLTMSVAAIVATTVAYFFSQSLVIKEIMLIVLIGVLADVIYTWILNAGILRWYLENPKHRKGVSHE